MRRVGSLSGKVSRGSRNTFQIQMLPNDIVVGTPEISAVVTLGHAAVMNRHDTAELERTFRAVPTAPGVTLASDDESVGTVNEAGLLERVGAGGSVRVAGVNVAGVKALGPKAEIYHAPVEVSYQFKEWAVGSAARYFKDKLYAALPPPDAANLPMFSSFQYNVGGVRNPLNWAADAGWDLSCISVDRPNSCLIASDVLLQAEHYPDHGKTAFVGMDGTIHVRDIVDSVFMGKRWSLIATPTTESHQSDFRVLKLDSPLPANVKPALLPPLDGEDYLSDMTTVTNYIPNVSETGIENLFPKAFLPVMHSNQDKTTQIFDLWNISRAVNANVTSFRRPPQAFEGQTADDLFREAYFRKPRIGDSGSNQFLPPLAGDDRLTVLGCFTSVFLGTNIFMFLDEMKAAAVTMGCVGVPEHANWSAFTKPA